MGLAKTPQNERTLGAAYTDSTKGLTPDEEKLLKACLGDADGDMENNLEVYNWDYGTPNSTNTPHIVKLAPTDDSKSGMYYAGTFNLVWYGLATSDDTRKFAVFPTSGVATVLATNKTAVTARFDRGATKVYTSSDTSCPELEISHINHETIMNACL